MAFKVIKFFLIIFLISIFPLSNCEQFNFRDLEVLMVTDAGHDVNNVTIGNEDGETNNIHRLEIMRGDIFDRFASSSQAPPRKVFRINHFDKEKDIGPRYLNRGFSMLKRALRGSIKEELKGVPIDSIKKHSNTTSTTKEPNKHTDTDSTRKLDVGPSENITDGPIPTTSSSAPATVTVLHNKIRRKRFPVEELKVKYVDTDFLSYTFHNEVIFSSANQAEHMTYRPQRLSYRPVILPKVTSVLTTRRLFYPTLAPMLNVTIFHQATHQSNYTSTPTRAPPSQATLHPVVLPTPSHLTLSTTSSTTLSTTKSTTPVPRYSSTRPAVTMKPSIPVTTKFGPNYKLNASSDLKLTQPITKFVTHPLPTKPPIPVTKSPFWEKTKKVFYSLIAPPLQVILSRAKTNDSIQKQVNLHIVNPILKVMRTLKKTFDLNKKLPVFSDMRKIFESNILKPMVDALNQTQRRLDNNTAEVQKSFFKPLKSVVKLLMKKLKSPDQQILHVIIKDKVNPNKTLQNIFKPPKSDVVRTRIREFLKMQNEKNLRWAAAREIEIRQKEIKKKKKKLGNKRKPKKVNEYQILMQERVKKRKKAERLLKKLHQRRMKRIKQSTSKTS